MAIQWSFVKCYQGHSEVLKIFFGAFQNDGNKSHLNFLLSENINGSVATKSFNEFPVVFMSVRKEFSVTHTENLVTSCFAQYYLYLTIRGIARSDVFTRYILQEIPCSQRIV